MSVTKASQWKSLRFRRLQGPLVSETMKHRPIYRLPGLPSVFSTVIPGTASQWDPRDPQQRESAFPVPIPGWAPSKIHRLLASTIRYAAVHLVSTCRTFEHGSGNSSHREGDFKSQL